MREIFLEQLPSYIFPMELLAATLLYIYPVRKRKFFIPRLVLSCIGYFVAVTLAVHMDLLGSSDVTILYILYFFLCAFFATVVVYVICDETYLFCVYCAAFAYTTQHFAYNTHCVLCEIYDPTSLDRYTIYYVIIYLFVYLLFYNVFWKKILWAKNNRVNWKYSIGIIVLTLGVTLFLSSLAQKYSDDDKKLYRILFLYAMFCCFSLLWNQLYYIKSLRLENELVIQKMLWKERGQQYSITKENIEMINRKCHALKHEIEVLRETDDENLKVKMLDKIEQSVMLYDSVVETGNDVIDTILTQKNIICELNKITLTCIIDAKSLDFLDAIDLYTIFEKMVNNAIRNVSGLDDFKKRVISITVFEKAEMAFIQCEYYDNCNTTLSRNRKSGLLKADEKFYGSEINDIELVVKKYHGMVTTETDNQILIFRISIPKNS